MTDDIVVIMCEVCGDGISGEAVHYVTEHLQVFCALCAQHPVNHAVMYRNCATPGHTGDDHAVFLGTRLAAVQELHRLAVAATEVSDGSL